MILKEVTISKSDVSPVAKLKGKVNSDSFTVDGVKHEAMTVSFLGFAGSSVPPDHKTYRGNYQFQPQVIDATKNPQSMTVSSLPGWSGAVAKVKPFVRQPPE